MAEIEKKSIELQLNDLLPLLFSDNLAISTRGDGLHLLRFSCSLPEGHKELARLMVPPDRLKKMLDMLCSHCDYYPAKAKKEPKKKKAPKKRSASKKIK